MEAKDVEMIQNIDQVDWEPWRVDIELCAEWNVATVKQLDKPFG